MTFLYPLTVVAVVFFPILWHAGLAGGQALARLARRSAPTTDRRRVRGSVSADAAA